MDYQQPSNPPWTYVDESIKANVIVCGALIVSIEKVVEAEMTLQQAKESVGVSSDVTLHCSKMFHPDGRRGTAWAHLEAAQINAMVFNLCRDLKKIVHRPLVSIFPTSWPTAPALDGAPRISLSDKGIAILAYQAIFPRLTLEYGKGVRVWIDPDSTMIPWGNQKRQAHYTRAVSMDLDPDRPHIHLNQ
ncbi:MAG: hypothetical protein ABI945_03490 [Nitrospirales bacterium]